MSSNMPGYDDGRLDAIAKAAIRNNWGNWDTCKEIDRVFGYSGSDRQDQIRSMVDQKRQDLENSGYRG